MPTRELIFWQTTYSQNIRRTYKISRTQDIISIVILVQNNTDFLSVYLCSCDGDEVRTSEDQTFPISTLVSDNPKSIGKIWIPFYVSHWGSLHSYKMEISIRPGHSGCIILHRASQLLKVLRTPLPNYFYVIIAFGIGLLLHAEGLKCTALKPPICLTRSHRTMSQVIPHVNLIKQKICSETLSRLDSHPSDVKFPHTRQWPIRPAN